MLTRWNDTKDKNVSAVGGFACFTVTIRPFALLVLNNQSRNNTHPLLSTTQTVTVSHSSLLSAATLLLSYHWCVFSCKSLLLVSWLEGLLGVLPGGTTRALPHLGRRQSTKSPVSTSKAGKRRRMEDGYREHKANMDREDLEARERRLSRANSRVHALMR